MVITLLVSFTNYFGHFQSILFKKIFALFSIDTHLECVYFTLECKSHMSKKLYKCKKMTRPELPQQAKSAGGEDRTPDLRIMRPAQLPTVLLPLRGFAN